MTITAIRENFAANRVAGSLTASTIGNAPTTLRLVVNLSSTPARGQRSISSWIFASVSRRRLL